LIAGFDNGDGDLFDGGGGNDTYRIAASAVAGFQFNVDLESGSDQFGNTFVGIENVIGGDSNDILRGNDDANTLDGHLGDDEIYGRGGDDIIIGGDGDDNLNGDLGDDTLQGGSGNDTLDATMS